MNSQKLILPFKHNLISASYKNTMYQSKWGYPHFGIDMGCEESGYNTYALGNGKVLYCGLNNDAINNGLGNCIIIKYDNVLCNDGKVRNLICQMFHFDKILVKQGQNVTNKTIIGLYGNTGRYYKKTNGRHLHLQFSTDINNPKKCKGIAPTSSGNIVIQSSIDNTIDPSNVWFLGKGQTIKGCTPNWYTTKDIELKKVDMNINAQYLIQPINNMVISCSYKNKPYETKFRLGTHYGVDFYGYGERLIYGSGNGEVLSHGYDNCFGNFLVIRYNNAYNHKTKKCNDVVFRYFHMNSLAVHKGDKINKDTKLGIMGNTGKYSSGIHCHLECDTDCKYYNYTPTLSRSNTTFFKIGDRINDTTVNPMEYIHCKFTKPDYQRISKTNDVYSHKDDINIPKIK